MPLFVAKAPLIEVHQWHRNGDHPEDRTINRINSGKVVKRIAFKQQVEADHICAQCKKPMSAHGIIHPHRRYRNTTALVACPGDYIRSHYNTQNQVVGYSVVKAEHIDSFYEPYTAAAQ